ncbi:MAG: ParB/RepB/Spo0J family partition protein, partial [Faecalibacillus sp.]
MKKPLPKINTSSLDELFTNEEQRQEAKLEKIMELPISDIQEFKNHPFKVRQDEQMLKLIDSVTENGILVPTLVRPSQDRNGYEMVSGHRRMKAAELNGLDKVPAIVRDLSDDQATIIMVDSNIQRETILPSERGFAYKMKLEAMNRQVGRPKENGSQVGNHLKGKKSIMILADEVGESKNQIHRYIRLTELIEPLRDMVDGL